MKIFVANNYSDKTMGGGFVFAHNFVDAMLAHDVEFTDTHLDADIVFIPAPTMLNDKEMANQILASKKPIVLRLDNAVRDSRNRGTGMSRMLKYASSASAIVYQSQWAKSFLHPWLEKEAAPAWYRHNEEKGKPVDVRVIVNGVDTNLFHPSKSEDDRVRKERKEPIVLYSRHNRDEVKSWHIAWYWYVEFARQHKNAALWLIGQFSPELVQYNFDFFANEEIKYWGAIDNREQYAKVLRTADIFYAPYDYDACSNAVLEARASGLQIVTRPDPTGGIPELLDPELDISLERMGQEYFDLFTSLLK